MPQLIGDVLKEIVTAWNICRCKRRMISPVLDYDQYWSLRQGNSEADLRARDVLMARLIEDRSSVLDIGCGSGRFLDYLVHIKKELNVLGLDISKTAIETGRVSGLNCEMADVSSDKFELQGTYDYIIMAEVVEHLHNPESLMLKLKGKYRKALFVTIPNIGYYPHRVRLMTGSFPVQTVYHPAEHLLYWTVRDFKEWLQQLGYRVDQVIASNGFPRLAKYWPNLFGNQVIFVLPP